MSAARRVARGQRRRTAHAAGRQAVVRELHVTGLRAHVLEVDAIARRDGTHLMGDHEMVNPIGPDLAGAQVVLAGDARDVARIERAMRRAAADRMVVIEPVRTEEEHWRARRIAAYLLGEAEVPS